MVERGVAFGAAPLSHDFDFGFDFGFDFDFDFVLR
jgi:hypothetical protein